MFCACKYRRSRDVSYFFFNDTATTEIYTLSLHDALPISFDLVKVKGRHYYIYNYTGHLNDMKNVSIILSYPKESFQKEGSLKAFISTDLVLKPLDIIFKYTDRWAIEPFFRDCKNYLGLEDRKSVV